MTGTINWTVDAQFKKIVAKAVQHGLQPHMVKNNGIYIALAPPKGKTGAPIVAYADGYSDHKAGTAAWEEQRERLNEMLGGDDFVEDIPMDFLTQVVDTECTQFTARFTATQVSYKAQGQKKPTKGGTTWVEKFHDFLDKQNLPTIKLFVKCADAWENDVEPPKGWVDAKTEAKRLKMVAWLKSEFNEIEVCRELNSDYKDKQEALVKLNKMRKARGMKVVEVF